jgi:hypothetical protein
VNKTRLLEGIKQTIASGGPTPPHLRTLVDTMLAASNLGNASFELGGRTARLATTALQRGHDPLPGTTACFTPDFDSKELTQERYLQHAGRPSPAADVGPRLG